MQYTVFQPKQKEDVLAVKREYPMRVWKKTERTHGERGKDIENHGDILF